MKLTRLLTDKEIKLANDYSTREETKRKKGDYTILDNVKPFDAINKLGQLEDIEEELGIDLVTLFKALKNGFYYKGKEKKCRSCYVSACFGSIELKNAGIRYSTISNQKYFYFNDYGKTWALTKEELE